MSFAQVVACDSCIECKFTKSLFCIFFVNDGIIGIVAIKMNNITVITQIAVKCGIFKKIFAG